MSNTNENARYLNTDDGWDEIVNENAKQRISARERVAARKRERKLRKLWLSVCVLATIGITYVILGITGAIAGWLAMAVAIVVDMLGCFLFGRYVEARKA